MDDWWFSECRETDQGLLVRFFTVRCILKTGIIEKVWMLLKISNLIANIKPVNGNPNWPSGFLMNIMLRDTTYPLFPPQFRGHFVSLSSRLSSIFFLLVTVKSLFWCDFLPRGIYGRPSSSLSLPLSVSSPVPSIMWFFFYAALEFIFFESNAPNMCTNLFLLANTKRHFWRRYFHMWISGRVGWQTRISFIIFQRHINGRL